MDHSSWANAYHSPETPEYLIPKMPVYGFSEFLPGEVWAGVYPFPSDNRYHVELFKHLLNTGVNSIVNLNTPREYHGKFSYRNTLLQAARGMKRKVEIEKFSLPFRAAPARLQVKHTLKFISRELKQGKRVYIHAGQNLEGRTPLILACLLIERGYSAKKALAKVNTFWMKTLHFSIRSPLSEEQLQFILDWRQET